MRRWWVLGGILGAALLTVLALTIPDGVRVGLAVVGCLLLPGLGWALKMRFSDLGDPVALAVVLSICSTVAVGTAMAVSGGWSANAVDNVAPAAPMGPPSEIWIGELAPGKSGSHAQPSA